MLGESLTFAHDGQLCGYCLSNPDDPFGDSFDDRCRNKLMGGAYIDSREGGQTPQEVIAHLIGVDDGEDDESYLDDDAPSSQYELYCAMSMRNQAVYLAKFKVRICNLLGVSYLDWEPADALALDAIQDNTPDDVLRDQAYAAYMAEPVPDEDNPSDEYPELGEDDDSVAPHQDLEGVVRLDCEFSYGRRERDRRLVSNSLGKRHWKCARRETMRRNWDFFNEDPIEIEAARRDATLAALFASDVDTEPEPTVMMDSTWSPALPWECYSEEELADAANEMHVWVTTGRPPWWSYQPSFDYNNKRDRFYDFYDSYDLYDPYDDYEFRSDTQHDDDETAHPSECTCGACLAERYADRDDHCGDLMCSHCNSARDIIAGYGEDDRSIDEQLMKFGTQERIRNSVARGRRA